MRWGEKSTLRLFGYTAHVLRPVILFGIQRADLHGFEAKVALWDRWDLKKPLRAAQYSVMNPELEVREPELYTQLSSNELHKFG